jgi:formylglycine-generating enzyme required for sulfatase activity
VRAKRPPWNWSYSFPAYPVTYAQYRAFLDAADGYQDARWWVGLTQASEPGRQQRPYASYPADHVSWHDATAFCRWLSARLGHEVRLPDEWEWQWAAKSARHWGSEWRDGVANTYEAGIGRTTAVGVYPGGRSRQGVYDLCGNVREWCRNQYSQRQDRRPAKTGSRVVRGGSWSGTRHEARAGDRSGVGPHGRYDDLGLRVLCVPPIH